MLFNTSKYYTLLVLSVVAALAAAGQPSANKPSPSSTIPTVTNVFTPAAYSGTYPVNYIRTWEAMKPITDPNALATAPYSEVRQTTGYFDGLGRPLQTVVREATPGITPKDLVSPVHYDEFGREAYKFIPYVSGVSDGLFRTNPFAEQKTCLEGLYASPAEKVFYSKTNFEASPLNRVEKAMAPGNSWAGSNNGVAQQYLVNEEGDNVVIWDITSNALTYTGNDVATNIPTVATGTYYNPGELYKNVTIDEKGNAVVEYRDKEARVILKKVQVDAVASDYSGYMGFLCTYYVYDDLNNLRFVLPPKAVEAIRNDWILASETEVINELCFRYEYDHRNRMIAKKVPGAGWNYMIYDVRDRLVFTQDANGRLKNQWITNLYDILNRLVITGITTWTGTPTTLQTYVTSQTTNPTIPSPPGTPADITLAATYNDAHVATNSIKLDIGFIGQPGFSAQILSGTPISGTEVVEGVTVSQYAIPIDATFTALTITYYDNYSWTTKTYNTTYNSQLTTGVGTDINPHAEALPSTASQRTTGLVTGTKTRVIQDPNDLAAGQWLSSVTFYDDKARVIQTQSINHKSDEDIITMMYDFSGKTLCTYLVHKNNEASADPLRIRTNYLYDHGGRLLKTWKTINDETAKTALISNNEYDQLGRLKKKELGRQKDPVTGNYTTLPIETLDYTYNVRGWLQGVNKDYVADGGTGNRWFGMELNYDWGFQNNQLNGNIAGMKWRSKGDGAKRAYGFSYDPVNRLLGADFAQHNGTGFVDNSTINFDMQMGNGTTANTAYDENGNIMAMKQWGLKVNNSAVIDELQYTYHSNSNKLSKVTDVSTGGTSPTGPAGTGLGDFTDKNTVGDDYGYDHNGNLLTDKNKGIGANTGKDILPAGSDMVYNHLNLPWKITVPQKGTITYLYDATGNKLQKKVEDISVSGRTVTTITDYIAGMVYESKTTTGTPSPGSQENYTSRLQFIGQEEGRIRYLPAEGTAPAAYVYDYFVKDHLGNVRMVLTEEIKKGQYLASMELAARTQEELLFGNISQTALAKSDVQEVYPTDPNPLTDPNNYVAKLSGSGNKVGPSIMLKVMSGDKVDFGVSYFYKSGGTGGDYASVFNDVLTSLAGGMVGVVGESKGTLDALSNINTSPLLGALNGFLPGNNPNQPLKPKAYLNWIMLDEQLNYVSGSSGAMPVGAANAVLPLAPGEINIPKNGYLYIYVSNEDKFWNVYFDNLSVNHQTGPLLEETHYYPFGLTMAGVSSKAIGKLENKYKYNGIEQNTDFDLNVYDAFYRNLDPQIGRFWQVDPVTTHGEAPYAAMQNNPVSKFDWLGNYFTWANETVQNTYNRLREENSARLGQYWGELVNILQSGESGKSIDKKINQLSYLINSHAELNTQWNEMEESDIEFHVSSESSRKGSMGSTLYSRNEHRVNIKMGKFDKDISLMAHEFRHGYSYINGELAVGRGSDYELYDITDEVVAYNAGYLFTDRNTANLVAAGYYDVNWFSTTQIGEDYNEIKGRVESISVNTAAATYLKYFKHERMVHIMDINKSNANYTVKDAIDGLNVITNKIGIRPEFLYGNMLKNR